MKLTWGRLVLLARAPVMVPGVVAIQAALYEMVNFPVVVGASVVLFLLVAACMAAMLGERKALERQLEFRTFHDHLTGLPNRALFEDRLEQALARAERHGGKVAVLFMDLDDFKAVNDSLGHQAGDRLLVVAAGRLRACLRPADTPARLGGDEFAILLEDVEDEQQAVRVARRILEALRAPFALGELEAAIGASVGIAFSTAQDRPKELLGKADLALYQLHLSGTVLGQNGANSKLGLFVVLKHWPGSAARGLVAESGEDEVDVLCFETYRWSHSPSRRNLQ